MSSAFPDRSSKSRAITYNNYGGVTWASRRLTSSGKPQAGIQHRKRSGCRSANRSKINGIFVGTSCRKRHNQRRSCCGRSRTSTTGKSARKNCLKQIQTVTSGDSGESCFFRKRSAVLLYAGGIAIRQQDILRFEQALKILKVQQIVQRESPKRSFLLLKR